MKKIIAKNRIIIILSFLCFIVLVTSTVFAISFTIQELRPYTTETLTFTLNDSDTYYDQIDYSNSKSSFNVKKTDNSNKSINSFDVVLYSTKDDIKLNNLSPNKKEEIESGRNCYIFRNIEYVSGGLQLSILSQNSEDESMEVAILNASSKNAYISSFYELKQASAENGFNGAEEAIVPTGSETYFKNLYFISDFTIDSDFTINYPCCINLLYSNVILKSTLKIKHSGYGYYAIQTITGKIDNSLGKLEINCPNCYYRTSNVETDITETVESILTITDSDRYVKNSDNVDFTLSKNKALLDALILDAESFVSNKLPNQILCDLVLPSAYQNYGVLYSYTVSDSLSDCLNQHGKVNRKSDTQTGTMTVELTFKDVSYSFKKECSVVGTDDSAVCKSYSVYLGNEVNKMSNPDGSNVILKDSEISRLTSLFYVQSGYTGELSLSFDNARSLSIKIGNNNYGKIFFKYLNQKLMYSINNSDYIECDGEIYIAVNNWVLDASSQEIEVTAGNSQEVVTFAIQPIDDPQMFLNRYLNNAYFSKLTDYCEVLSVFDGNIIFGDQTQEKNVIGALSALSDITYKMYFIQKTTLTRLNNGTLSLSEFLSSDMYYTDYTNYFNILEGKFMPKSGTKLKLESNESLIYVANFVYKDSNDYQVYRQIVLSTSGLGGNEYTDYVSGNTFGSYFDNLEDGKLIDSVASDPNTYVFESKSPSIGLEMKILNEDVSDFCTLVYSSGKYKIDININNILPKNIVIHIYVKFYLIDDPTQIISEQNYRFTIPGIYKKKINFADDNLYDRIINAKDKDGKSLYDSFDGYLLVDGAQNTVECLDASFNLLNKDDNSLDLSGIELLTNTYGLILDNNLISSLEPFSKYTTYNLQNLSLVNCGITDQMLLNNYLKSLKSLKSVNLSQNSISKLSVNGESIVYRTVENLNIDSQKTSLDNIDDLILLPNLTTFSAKNNHIKNFYQLINLDKLIDVYICNNIADEFTGKDSDDNNVYYGTSGLINQRIYVSLERKGVNLYITSESTKFTLEDNQILELCYDLNSICNFTDQYNSISIPNTLYEEKYNSQDGTQNGSPIGVSALYVIDSDSNSTRTIVSHSNDQLIISGVPSGSSISVIISVTKNSKTIYGEYYFTYMN